MQPANRREVDRGAWRERLKSDDANWWIETEVGWSWSLWASDRDDFALNVVCGSVGIWEEWVALGPEAIADLNRARRMNDHQQVHRIAAHLAQAHSCGGD